MRPVTYEMLPSLIGKEIYLDKNEKGLLVRYSNRIYAVLSNNPSLNGFWYDDLAIKYDGIYKYSWRFIHEDDLEEMKNKNIELVNRQCLYCNLEVEEYGEL